MLSVLLSVSGCPPCLPVCPGRRAYADGRVHIAGGRAHADGRVRTHGQAHARDPRGGRVPLRTLHIAERELL